MSFFHTQRAQRRTSLLALFVLLWGLVFPSLAQAGVGNANAVWVEICTAHGIQRVQQELAKASDNTNTSDSHQLAAEHCILCLGGAPGAVTMPVSVEGFSLEPQAFLLPRSDFPLAESLILLTAPPRAPPFLSLA
jgi:hypothetical protein